MAKLQIIIGSTRPGRAADLVAPWVVATAREHPAFDVEVLDLRDWPLPMFGEHMGSIGDLRDPTYSDPVVRAWNRKIKEGDAYIVITPEYNHSVPGVVKNALDSVFLSFGLRHKPVAAVSYSNGVGAGVRAVEHLAHIVVEADGVPLRAAVLIPFVNEAFEDGEPRSRATRIALDIQLEDLAWWSDALAPARAAGEPAPANFRLRAALAATPA